MSSQDQTTAGQTVTPDRDERLATHDLLDTAAAEGDYTRFLAAVSATGIANELRGPDLLTVFIPDNAAFDRFDGGRTHGMDLSKLAGALRHHIVPGAITAAELGSTPSVNTLQGTALRIVRENGGLRVDGARVVRPDIECSNGVIHVIDSVLEF